MQDVRHELDLIKPLSRKLKRAVYRWSRARSRYDIDKLSLTINSLSTMDQLKYFIYGQCQVLLHIYEELAKLPSPLQRECLISIWHNSREFMLNIGIFTMSIKKKYLNMYSQLYAVLINKT